MKTRPRLVTEERGFSVREFALTLVLLTVVIVVAVRLIDLRTKLLAVEKDDPGPGSGLDVAIRLVSRDLDAAGRGGLAPGEAVRPVEDNTGAEAVPRRREPDGAEIAARPGADQLGLRGVIRSPLLALAPFREAEGSKFADEIRRGASSVHLRAGATEQKAGGAEKVQAVVERLSATASRSKRFFLVADASGRHAIAVVRAWTRSKDLDRALEVDLDFTDEEAANLNSQDDVKAVFSLGVPVAGGLFDELVWFIAQGAEGRRPDYEPSRDPPSMKFPHPYLAVAEFAGKGRWEITRVREDIEDFQVAWGLAGAAGGLVWRAGDAGSRPPTFSELVDSAGNPALRALKLALSAKAERRYARGDGPQPPTDFRPLLNAPAPSTTAGGGPVGWDPDESRRVPFERASREVVLPLPGAESRAPR